MSLLWPPTLLCGRKREEYSLNKPWSFSNQVLVFKWNEKKGLYQFSPSWSYIITQDRCLVGVLVPPRASHPSLEISLTMLTLAEHVDRESKGSFVLCILYLVEGSVIHSPVMVICSPCDLSWASQSIPQEFWARVRRKSFLSFYRIATAIDSHWTSHIETEI